MPIYEYLCPACGHPFEKRVSFNESDKEQTCPACGFEKTQKQISLIGQPSIGTKGAGQKSAPACGPVG